MNYTSSIPFLSLGKGFFYFYLKDHLGTIRAVTNASNEIISSYDFDAWGYPLREWNLSDNSKYKFTGKERDIETNYDYFGARYYDARIGRWGGTDPLFEKHINFTPYNYVLNNQMILVDPNGKQEISTFAAGALAVGATMTAQYWLSAEGLVAGAFFAISALPNTADAPGVVHDRNLIKVESDIQVKPMLTETKQVGKIIKGKINNVQEHIDKLLGRVPGKDPNKGNNRDTWLYHTDKAILALYEAVKKIDKNYTVKEYIEKLINQGKLDGEKMLQIAYDIKDLPLRFKDYIIK